MAQTTKRDSSPENIIDLTEIVERGSLPSSAERKGVVDFDSALSDLLDKKSKVISLDDTPELEDLLAGLENNEPSPASYQKKEQDEKSDEPVDRANSDEPPMDIPGLEDMDDLINKLDVPPGGKRTGSTPGDAGAGTPPDTVVPKTSEADALRPGAFNSETPGAVASDRSAEVDVDALLDSLLDESPAPVTPKVVNQEISESDLDDLLNSIELESSGGKSAAEPVVELLLPSEQDLAKDVAMPVPPTPVSAPATAQSAGIPDFSNLDKDTKVETSPDKNVDAEAVEASPNDLGALFKNMDADSSEDVPHSADSTDSVLNDVCAETPEQPVALSASPQAAFDAEDFADLDALFAQATPVPSGSSAPSALPEPVLPESALPESALPESALPEPVVPEPGMPTALLIERMEQLEGALTAIRERMHVMEERDVELQNEFEHSVHQEQLPESLPLATWDEFKRDMDMAESAHAQALTEQEQRITVLLEQNERCAAALATAEERLTALERDRVDPAHIAGLADRLAVLEGQLQRQQELEERLAELEDRPNLVMENPQPTDGSDVLSGLDAQVALEGLEQRLVVLETQQQSVAIERRLATLEADQANKLDSATMATQVLEILRKDIDRAAAESAAHVLREEIAALLGEKE